MLLTYILAWYLLESVSQKTETNICNGIVSELSK